MGQSPRWAVPPLLINGHLFSHASIEADVNGLVYAGITAISYEDSVTPGVLFGTEGALVGRTPGNGKPSLSMTMLRREWDHLRSELVAGPGSAGDGSFGTNSFQVNVTYHEDALPSGGASLTAGVTPADSFDQGPSQAQTVMDVIDGVRITGVAQASAAGADPALVVLTCAPVRIRWGGHAQSTRSGSTNLSDAAPTPTETGDWWASTEDGYEGTDYQPNPWDSFIISGFQLPGLCKTKATPKQIVDSQRPNGSDAAALIIRGYGPCEISIEVTLWLRSHWVIWQNFVRTFWRPPNKSSAFERPELKTRSAKDAKIAPPDNRAIIKERAAIARSENNAKVEALAVYHPALAALGIGAAIITSIEAPVPGPQTQTFTSRISLTQYIVASAWRDEPQNRRVQNTRNSVLTVAHPLRMETSQKTPYYIANSSATTPADTDSAPDAHFTPSYLPK